MKIGPSCTAQREECDGEDEDLRKTSAVVRNLSRCLQKVGDPPIAKAKSLKNIIRIVEKCFRTEHSICKTHFLKKTDGFRIPFSLMWKPFFSDFAFEECTEREATRPHRRLRARRRRRGSSAPAPGGPASASRTSRNGRGGVSGGAPLGEDF